MENKQQNKRDLIISYLTLRKIIGIQGFTLPLVLYLGALILFQTNIQSSISSYYHTGMRGWFVGALFVIGFFLFSYKGYEIIDDIAGYFGGVFAVGVALFPTTPDNATSSHAQLIGYVHLAFAALFFATLIFFSLALFPKTNKDKKIVPTKRELQRNIVYKACGYTMCICIFLICVYSILPDERASFLKEYNPVFWLEAIAIEAFGISWITKGELLWWDAKEKDKTLHKV
ncbi:MAG: DUF998 domain-containing protein [Planctomycetes bacterium]|nr:DUF998 domain-containing protein [Planctomycetota bacterium]